MMERPPGAQKGENRRWGGLVHDNPQSLILPFPLHQVSGYFRCAAGGNVKLLLPGTEVQGLAGSEEQREEAAECAEGRNPAAEM